MTTQSIKVKGRAVKEQPRLLWIGDAVAHTGFSVVTHGVLDNLCKKYDVHVLGINYFGDPHKYNYKIYPAAPGGDLFGIGRAKGIIQAIKPHVICVLNDPWLVRDYLDALNTSIGQTPDGQELFPHKIAYMPIDALNIKKDFVRPLSNLDSAVFYTEFGKEQALNAGLELDSVHVIPHGINTDEFSPMPIAKARAQLNQLPNDLFIVGCINRNQPRKRLDLAVQYFAEFAKDKPDNVKFYYHGALQDQGWDILQLADYYGISERIIITSPHLTTSQGVPREILRYIYGSFDVQITTTLGEGWGLTQMEGMACQVPQIMPRWSALGEWANGGAEFVECTSTAASTGGLNTIGGIADRQQFIDALNRMYFDDTYRNTIAQAGYDLVNQQKYTWSAVANQFDTVFRTIMYGDRNTKA